MWRRHGVGAGDQGAAARAARWVTLGSTLLFTFVLCRWRPWTLFDRAGFSNDFYDEQARAFWHLRLHVPPEVAGPEGFLIGGRTYLYYGPFLAVLRMPFVLVGDWFDGRLTRVSMVAAFVLACTVAFQLLRRVAGRLHVDLTPWRAGGFVAAVALSPLLALAGWVSVYHETELWAFALLLLTFVLLDDVVTAPTTRHIAFAGLAALATVMTRASIGYGALAAVGLTAIVLWRRNERRAATHTALWPVGAFVAAVAINWAKFGTLLDLPADRQLLTLQNPSRAAWFAGNGGSFFSTRFVPTTVVQYLRPDSVRFDRLIPFVRFGPLAHVYGSYPLEGNTPASSLTASATALFIAAIVGAVVLVRRRGWFAAPWTAGAIVAALPTIAIGFVANRYLVDLLPLLVVPAAAAFAASTLIRRTGPRVALVALLVWGAACNVALATWISELKNPGFSELRYRFDEWVFGGPPPDVQAYNADAPVPHDGSLAIDGSCDALYIAEHGHWAVLELRDDSRRLAGEYTVSPGTDDAVLPIEQGTLWARTADDGSTLTLRWEPIAGDVVTGAEIEVPSDGDVELVVTSDPVTGAFEVRVDGDSALFVFAAPQLGIGGDRSAAWDVQPADDFSTPVCNLLVRRMHD